jgi:glycosyltransferase involved in cell wall biosynthesis
MKPLVSVVIEGYNEEATALSTLPDTVGALLQQDFPLDQVELVMLGSPQQTEYWKTLNPGGESFFQVQMIPVNPEDGHYWTLKNMGATFAEGEIIAHIDSDSLPGPRWLSSLVRGIQSGADVSVGPSLYRTERQTSESPWMMAASLPSWSLMVARTPNGQGPCAGCVMAHNVALRRTVVQEHRFQPGKRSYPSALMYLELARAGVKIAFQPEQKVAHSVTFRWWLGRKHFRTGWETYLARSADKDWPRIPALERVKIVEPLLLRMGLVFRDARHWFRFAPVVGLSRSRTVLLFPVAVLASLAARTAEMVGMYAVLLAPKSTEYQARF